MVFEHRKQPLISPQAFAKRLAKHILLVFLVAACSLTLGVLGYHYFEGMAWIDAVLNASMILGGMGPVDALHTTAGKIFASCYALFSGMMILLIMGVLFAPIVHRFLHRFHLGMESESGAR